MSQDIDYWRPGLSQRLSRRRMLVESARIGLGVVGLSLLGCATTTTPPTPPSTPKPAGPTPTPVPTYGGTLIVSQRGTTTLDPDITSGGQDAFQLRNLYNGLTGLDVKGRPVPELATSWEFPDPTTVIMKLRKNVKFHDGVDFNAQVVKANYDRTMNPATKSKEKAKVDDVIKSYAVVDDYTFRFNLKRPSASFLSVATSRQTGSGSAGYMKSPEALKKYNNDLREHGVGTGPFEFVEWRLDDRITVKKFPGFWEKGVPYLDQITWRVIPDSTVALTMLKSGEVQFDNWFDFKDYEIIKADPNLVLVAETVPGYVSISFSQGKPPFNNRALRQAVVYAIDREAISRVVYKGIQPPSEGLYGPDSWAHDPKIKSYPLDLAKAKEKLKEAGVPDNFEFTLSVASAFPDWVQQGEMIQSMLAKIGVKAKLELVERAKMSTLRNAGDFEAESVGSSGDTEPHQDLVGKFYSKGARPKNFDPNNPDTKKVDALIEKGDSVYDIEERRATYSELQKLLIDLAYAYFPFTYQTSRVAYRKEVKGYVQFPGTYATDLWRVWRAK
ncbi:MAG: hypothetical protein HYU86_06800 [Chloroflexi bacterium]|nr:hypothetical protein [Chloroflexota bacterium]